jgi:diguanylate cyclase (GGDEF)-like protein/PAS domain S-box-containing protein
MITAAHQRLNASTDKLTKTQFLVRNSTLLENETARLAALHRCRILDTPPEPEFDEIVRLAALICGTPIACISFIDLDRQWFKARFGWQIESISRHLALCERAIRQKEVSIVSDTLTDSQFATHPLVCSQPYIRFYASVPLIVADGYAVGTLCAIDCETRELDLQQVEALQTLGRQVVKLLEQRCDRFQSDSTSDRQYLSSNRRFFTRMAAGLGLASAILIGAGVVSYQNLMSLGRNNHQQIQHHQVLEDLKGIHASIQKATIAQHRYITTGQPSYLEPYYDAAREIQSKITDLQQETVNNPHQQRRLSTLVPLIEKKFLEIERTTHLRKTQGVAAVSQIPLLEKSKHLADEIAAIAQEMERTEYALLEKQSQDDFKRTRQLVLAFAAAICLNIPIFTGIYGLTYQEMSDRQRRTTAIAQERDFSDAILDTAGALVVVLDPQGRILRCNRACEEMTARTAEEVQGKFFWELFSLPGEAEVSKSQWEKLLTSQAANQYENYWQNRDGSYRRIAWTNTILRDRHGVVECAIACGIDITAHSIAEESLRRSEQHLRKIVNSLFAFVAVLSVDGTLIEANQALLDVAALQPKDVIGKSLIQTYWWSYSPTVQAQLQSALDRVTQGERVRYEGEARVGDDRFITIDFAFTPMWDVTGKVGYIIASGTDVTERKQAEAAQAQANEQLSGWVNELKQRNHEIAYLSYTIDVLQACFTLEEACTTLAQLVQSLFPQASGGIFLSRDTKNSIEPVATWGVPLLANQQAFHPDDCWALRLGKPHWVDDADDGLLCKHVHHSLPAESLCVPLMAHRETFGVLYLGSLEKGVLSPAKRQLAIRVAEHIAPTLANLKLRDTLKDQSVRDSLTGLFNRRYMEEALQREILRCDRKQQPLSLIMLDVDHFKRFNDTLGHDAGDGVLRELGRCLQSYVRGSDIACRYGGEEFTLILPEASLGVTQLRAEQIRAAVKQLHIECSGQYVGAVTLSLGVASFPKHGLEAETILKAADTALYRAKQEGRDRVIVA